MQIAILGPIAVTTDGHTRGVRAAKVRTMLATLALKADRVIGCRELADELWAGEEVGNTSNALQAQATRVRKLLDEPSAARGTSVIRSVPGGYLLALPPESVDAHRFLSLASEGAAALADEPLRARELLEAALGLWRGPALLDAGDGLRCHSAAALYEERRLTVWEHLARALLALGEESRAVAELQQLVAQNPLNERFCELLMIALYRQGRQGDALRLFRTTQQRLDEELGIKPGSGLQKRHHQILCQDPSLARRHVPSNSCPAPDNDELLPA